MYCPKLKKLGFLDFSIKIDPLNMSSLLTHGFSPGVQNLAPHHHRMTDIPSLPVIPYVRIGVSLDHQHTSLGSGFRGSFHTSSKGMTGGFWKTRVLKKTWDDIHNSPP